MACASASQAPPLPPQKPTVQPASDRSARGQAGAGAGQEEAGGQRSATSGCHGFGAEGSTTLAAIFKREQSMTMNAAQ